MIPPIFIFKEEMNATRKTQQVKVKLPKCLRKQSAYTEERLNKLIFQMLTQEVIGAIKASKSNKYEKGKIILDRYNITEDELSIENLIKNLYRVEKNIV